MRQNQTIDQLVNQQTNQSNIQKHRTIQ